MNISGMGQMDQIQTQMQTRKMDGTGGGQGKGGANGMGQVMQNLSSEDRSAIQEQLQAIPQEEKTAIKDQLKAVDPSNMSSDEYFQVLNDILNPTKEDSSTTGEFVPVYA